MPHVLLLRFAAPMQSWGISSRFSIRDTAKEPSKSGVIGLLCAALGISRCEANKTDERFVKMTELKMGVRVLREGVPENDYHTAQKVAIADSEIKITKKIKIKNTELSKRHYLADADFLVALESDDAAFLTSLHEALQKPVWQLFLGRKAFVPAVPVYFREEVFEIESLKEFLLGKDGKLEEILKLYESEADTKQRKKEKQRVIIECAAGEETRMDVPRSFAPRDFTIRCVTTKFTELKNGGNENGNIFDENDFESEMPASAA